jgi:hypothetical protein
MQQEPVILQFDDDENYFTVVDLICYNMGLSIKAHASNINDTRAIISRIEQKQLKPDIAIVSDYLGNNFEDGSKLAKKLKEIAPEIKVIAYVIDPEIAWGDFQALKASKDVSKNIIGKLQQLTGHTFKDSNLPA